MVLAAAAMAAWTANAVTETVDGILWTYIVSGGTATAKGQPDRAFEAKLAE